LTAQATDDIIGISTPQAQKSPQDSIPDHLEPEPSPAIEIPATSIDVAPPPTAPVQA
jgi:hypothetical protein